MQIPRPASVWIRALEDGIQESGFSFKILRHLDEDGPWDTLEEQLVWNLCLS